LCRAMQQKWWSRQRQRAVLSPEVNLVSGTLILRSCRCKTRPCKTDFNINFNVLCRRRVLRGCLKSDIFCRSVICQYVYNVTHYQISHA
jgi:hypothetical protein